MTENNKRAGESGTTGGQATDKAKQKVTDAHADVGVSSRLVPSNSSNLGPLNVGHYLLSKF
jgi:hypothetical protein